jgi:hypothetical protein
MSEPWSLVTWSGRRRRLRVAWKHVACFFVILCGPPIGALLGLYLRHQL